VFGVGHVALKPAEKVAAGGAQLDQRLQLDRIVELGGGAALAMGCKVIITHPAYFLYRITKEIYRVVYE
jgi:hypothetical protein